MTEMEEEYDVTGFLYLRISKCKNVSYNAFKEFQ